MKVAFQQHTVRITNKYVCVCGHKFSRLCSDWYTMNPFHNKTHQECREEITKRLQTETRVCPKCKKSVPPVKRNAS